MRRQVDSYSMLICSKYVKSIEDMNNITLVNSKFKDNIEKLHFNPFKINTKSRKYFINLQTLWLFDKNDEIFTDGDISGYYVHYEMSYDKYLTMRNKYQNIKFRRIVYAENDKEKYGNEIPNVVNKLGNYLFQNSNIKEIVIPDSIFEIGNSCFKGCQSLTSITISSRLTNIGEYVFNNCNRLSSITLPSVLTSLNNGLFSYCYQLTTIEYSPFVVNLNDSMFYKAKEITTISIPTSITRIGDWCFNDCKLTSLTIPSSVIEVGKYAFSDNSELEEVELPNNMMQLSEAMFCRCENLTKINIPSSITKIGDNCFKGCNDFSIPTTIISRLLHIGGGCFVERRKTEITLNNDMTYIGEYAFSNNPIKTVIIPSSIRCLQSAFGSCSELTHIEIPDSVTCLGDYCLSSCINLKSLLLPISITKLGRYSFSRCSSLEYIVMPSLINELPDYCFYECKSLTTIELPPSLTKIGKECFKDCVKLKEVNIPMSVVRIGDTAFKNCSELQSITGNVDVCKKFRYSFSNTPSQDLLEKKLNKEI